MTFNPTDIGVNFVKIFYYASGKIIHEKDTNYVSQRVSY